MEHYQKEIKKSNKIDAAAVVAEADQFFGPDAIGHAELSADLTTSRNGSVGPPAEGQRQQLKPLRAIRMSDVETQSIDWLWQPFLAIGTFNILEGEEGIGKTFLVCALAAAIASGRGLPDVSGAKHIEASNVLLISAEDSLSHVLKPRLESMNAPCERIIAIEEPFTLNKDGVFRLSLALAKYEPKFIVLDPLFSYTGFVSLDRDNEIRSVTDELKRLAEKHQCCIVGIRHIGKSKGMGDVRNAGLNGVGWRASARSVLLVGKNPDNENQKAICQTKNNLAQKFEKSIGFGIAAGQFFWTGESSLTAQTMLSMMRTENSEERTEKQDAKSFLNDALLSGEQLSADLIAEARQCGISDRTLHRAKKELQIESRKAGFGKAAKWYWSRREDCQNSAEDCHIYKSGNLKVNGDNKTSCDNDLPEGCHIDIYGNLNEDVGNLREPIGSGWENIASAFRTRVQKTCEKCGAIVESYSVRCANCGELPLDI